MDRRAVDSQSLAAVGYDEQSETLEVEFNSGAVYQYFGVPRSVYAGLLSADSLGGFLNAHIRNRYRYLRL